MTNAEPSSRPRTDRLVRIVRRGWPAAAFVAGSLLGQQLLLKSRYDVGGHAAEHLNSATAPFMAAAVLAIAFWATPAARRQRELVITAVAWFIATLFVMAGNLRVVNDLVDAGHGRTPTGSVPDIAEHSLANSSPWYAAGIALIIVLTWQRRRHISNRATIAAVVISLIVPPWISPGAGVVVLAIIRLVQHVQHPEVVTR